jgi:hypothetical protein
VARKRNTIDEWAIWRDIVRDALLFVLGGFMLVFETVFAANPNAYLIGGGLAALGLPPALRLDLRTSAARRRQDEDAPDEDEDDYSGSIT